MSFVNPLHLNFLIDKLGRSPEEAQALKDQVKVAGDQELLAILDSFDRKWPGTKDRLIEIWRQQSGHQITLWVSDALRSELTAANAAKALNAAVSRSTVQSKHSSGLIELQKPRTNDSHIYQVKLEGNVLWARVRMVKPYSHRYFDSVRTGHRTSIIDVGVPAGSHSVVRTFAGYGDARASLKILLEWLLGTALPPKSPLLDPYMRPVSFRHEQIEKLAAQCGMELAGFWGPDAEGSGGSMGFQGEPVGHEIAPVPLKDKRIAPQLGTKKDYLTYNWSYVHTADHFEERPRIRYVFKGKPHLVFEEWTSRPAIDEVIEGLRIAIGL